MYISLILSFQISFKNQLRCRKFYPQSNLFETIPHTIRFVHSWSHRAYTCKRFESYRIESRRSNQFARCSIPSLPAGASFAAHSQNHDRSDRGRSLNPVGEERNKLRPDSAKTGLLPAAAVKRTGSTRRWNTRTRLSRNSYAPNPCTCQPRE